MQLLRYVIFILIKLVLTCQIVSGQVSTITETEREVFKMKRLKQISDSGELQAYVEDSMRDLMEWSDSVVRYCSLVIEDGDGEVHITLVGVRK